jgi:hypothetical protein
MTTTQELEQKIRNAEVRSVAKRVLTPVADTSVKRIELKRYSITIYIAAPGTPLVVDGGTSTPGHMYYSISDGSAVISAGFAPVKHGDFNGPGKHIDNDVKNYQNPIFARTMEISEDQYKKLNLFSTDSHSVGFDLHYSDVRNNCVDYVWNALKYSNIYSDSTVGIKFEGNLKPTNNVEPVKKITAPFPKSDLNSIKTNPLPKRGLLQIILSEEKSSSGSQIPT